MDTRIAQRGDGRTVRVAAYVRKSTEEGLEQAYNSLDCQRDAIEAYVRSQAGNGWVLHGTVYADPGFSGGSLDRPGLQALLSDIRRGGIDAVVVYKIDRLSRSLADFARLFQTFNQFHVTFVSVTQHIDTSSATGRMMLNILMSFAQFEREMSADRIRDKMRASLAKGMWMGGPVPYGYRVVNRKLVVEPAAASVVARVFELYARYGNPTRVAQQMEKDRLPTGTGAPWRSQIVQRLVRNPRYVGDARCGGKIVKGEQDALVGRDLWNRVQGVLERNAHIEARGRPHTPHSSLLRGLAFCGECDGLLSYRCTSKKPLGNGGCRRYGYYACTKAMRHGLGCKLRNVPSSLLEEALISRLAEVFASSLSLIGAAARRSGVPQGDLLAAVAKGGRGLAEAFGPEELRRIFLAVVKRIDVFPTELDFRFDISGIGADASEVMDLGRIEEDGVLRVNIPIQMKCISGERHIVRVVPGSEPVTARDADNPILRGVARAYSWMKMIDAGEVHSVEELASRLRLERHYVNHILRLATLSPRIVRAVISGCVPSGVSLSRIRHIRTDDWREQERALGFPEDQSASA